MWGLVAEVVVDFFFMLIAIVSLFPFVYGFEPDVLELSGNGSPPIPQNCC